jgi:hypothetical protein
MRVWSRGDVLSIASLALGVICLFLTVLNYLPSLLPDVVIVIDQSYQENPGFAVATTTFENKSWATSIGKWKAVWRLDPADVKVGVDQNAPRYRILDQKSEKTLQLLEPFPARYRIKTFFNSPSPFRIDLPSVEAIVSRESNGSIFTVPALVVPRAAYEERIKRTYYLFALSLIGVGAGFVLLCLVVKKIFFK